MKNQQDEGMQKYGVCQQESEELHKVASTGCPQCGAAIEKLAHHGDIIVCPHCGTAPFEKRRG